MVETRARKGAGLVARARAFRFPRSVPAQTLGRSFTGIALAGVGIALFAGGTTFSSWNAAVTLAPVTITAGTFNMALSGSQVWQDTTSGYASAINPATFYFTPGDTITMTQKFTTTLSGDNMRANLAVVVPGFTVGQPGITATYTAGREGTDGVLMAENVAVGTSSELALGAESRAYWVTVTFRYAPDAASVATNLSAVLGAIDIRLSQVVG